MSYMAIYRKFRPVKFSEIVGQEHITRTLRNQIIANRVGHAYLLTGGRGTGKTSAAKILARAINCLNPQDGEPCNECEICKAALNGSLTDIVEMDAASNNSVEDVRSIREEVNFLPTLAKYRVYIIDEVHMLSVGAFNALLKTLEEPPAHVKFILATTEPQKLPATILSRCQRFDYKTIPAEGIKSRLEYICKESKINITDEALKTISVLADGAMRDGLSILERCVQEGEELIDDNKVKELAGIPKTEYVNKILNSVLEYNVEETLKNINYVIVDGKDLSNLLWELIKYTKNVLVFKAGGKLDLYNEDELIQIEELAQKCSKDRLMKIIFSLSELANDLKTTTQKTIMLEVGIIKLCTKPEEFACNQVVVQQVPAQVQQIPVQQGTNENVQQIGNENFVQAKQVGNAGLEATIQPQTQQIQNQQVNINKQGSNFQNNVEEKAQNKPVAKVEASTITNNVAPTGKTNPNWSKIVKGFKDKGKIMLYTNLLNTSVTEINDMTVGIVFPNGITPFGRSILDKPESISELTKALSIEYGKSMQVRLIDNKRPEKPAKDDLSSLGIDINVIDE